MTIVACPHCSEEENLQGKNVDNTITVTCGECGLVWDRDMARRCPQCQTTNVRAAWQATLEKSRGNQLSIQSLNIVWLCADCDAGKLRRYLDSNVPIPPDNLPLANGA
ncbi:MAG: hypothetical protein OXB92_17070 [Acidimicrobiaceae bacterium]|nr:hypothetical protein [Acidimicrobiia bacterium]MCY4495558.1 hypothetical protein [Acidimicrobiaceae bacterium]